jgi:putative DNA-invertase from lambdoid prophage Rac
MRQKKKQSAVTASRVFGYVRVSTDNQAEFGASLGDQQERVDAYAKSMGLSMNRVFVEAGISGGKGFSTRPKGTELDSQLRPGDIVVATKLDRMFRSASDALRVVEDWQRRGIHLFLMDIGGDVTGNGVAKLVFSILAAVAEMERSRLSERVRSVKQHLTKQGRFTGGKLAVGFAITPDGRMASTKQWSVAVALMNQLRLEGTTYAAIGSRVRKDLKLPISTQTVWRVLNAKRELDGYTLPHVARGR